MTFTEEARAAAKAEYESSVRATGSKAPGAFAAGFEVGWDAHAEWQVSREVTDAEVLAALNAQNTTHEAPSLDYYASISVERMRAALEAAREVR